jgi:hypothetical protein
VERVRRGQAQAAPFEEGGRGRQAQEAEAGELGIEADALAQAVEGALRARDAESPRFVQVLD